ncbi:MAG: complement resistance protein TraT, partial [Gammaproteobacteria bacterium]
AMAGALAGGYGGALIGAVHSYRAFGNPYGGGMAGSLIGAGVGALAGHYLSDKTYMMVVDIQLQQRDANATTSTRSNITQGLATTTRTSGATMHGWMTYRDRIVAQAKGMRLSFDYAKPALVKEVGNELAGIF